MRTTTDFSIAWKNVEHFLSMHNKPIWLVAEGDDYHITVIKPTKENIAPGTSAIQYEKIDGEIVETGRINNFDGL